MSGSFKLYMAGAVSGLSFDEANKNRLQIESLFSSRVNSLKGILEIKSVKVFNPLDYYNFHDKKGFEKSEDEVRKFFLHQVRQCDIFIADMTFDKPSLGTIMELQTAYENDVPILVLCDDNSKMYPWVQYEALRVFDTVSGLVDYVIDYFLK